MRIGKQYRIARADLEALTGRPVEPAHRGRRVQVTSVIDVDGIDADAADRLAALVTGLPKGPGTGGSEPHVDVVHEPEHTRLKVIVVGPVTASVELLRFVAAMAEEQA